MDHPAYRFRRMILPDGEYVVLRFKANYENKASAEETLTMMKDEDDRGRVAGYFIR